jgi:hypothetical protein
MDAWDFNSTKEEFYEFLSQDYELTVVYRSLKATVQDSNVFGIVSNEVATDPTVIANTTLYGVTYSKPRDKVKDKLGVVEDVDLIVVLSTKELDDKHLTIERERALIVSDGVEFEITSVKPQPDMFGSSIAMVLGCQKRRPLNG